MKTILLRFAFLCLVVQGTIPLWSQVEPSATGGDITLDDSTRMMTPPPASDNSFPTEVGSETRSNYVAAGMAFTAAYVDNLYDSQSTSPVSDESYSIFPNINIERTTPRQVQSFNYGAGATLYHQTSNLNDITQSASADYQFRPSKYSSISFRDSFNQNSNSFNQPNPSQGRTVSGSPQPSTPVLVAPFQNQLSNSISGDVAYQFARDAMVGGGGSYSFLHYSNLSAASGINDSDSTGAQVFYNRRMGRSHYFGAIYSYARFSTHPLITTTDTNGFLMFYTFSPSRGISLSVTGGPQYFHATQPPYPSTSGWTPAIGGSIGWQARRMNLAASYMRAVSSGGGLVGTYFSNNVALSLQWLLWRKWSFGAGGNYSNNRSATPLYTSMNQGGHTTSATVSMHRRITERLSADLGYGRFNQSYSSIEPASNSPNSNRAYASVSYQFTRPLGR
jgi:hypothetical protein